MKKYIIAFLLGYVFFLTSSLFAQSFTDKTIQLKPKNYKLDITIDYDKEQLKGICQLTIINSADQSVQAVPLLLYRLMQVNNITTSEGDTLTFTQQVVSFEDFQQLQANYIEVALNNSLNTYESTTIIIEYEGYLLGYLETGMTYIKDHIDPEFTIIRPDCYAYPEIGVPCWEVNYKAGLPEFDYEIKITVPDSQVAVNSGIFIGEKTGEGTVTYSYKSAMPSWRIDIPIAKYGRLENGNKRIFYLAEDSIRAEKIMQAMTNTIKLYTAWFGTLHDQNQFTLIEIPDGYGSQTTASCIIQSAGAFKDDERLYELYHEISHLWNAPKTDPQPPRWEEGLAMFLQYLTIEKLEQRNILEQQMQRRLQSLHKTLKENPKYQNIPIIDYGKQNVTRLSYSTGMLFFYTLYSVLGEQNFLNIIGSFYQRYYANGATTEEFINHVKNNSKIDLSKLFSEWFYKADYCRFIISGLSLKEIVQRYN